MIPSLVSGGRRTTGVVFHKLVTSVTCLQAVQSDITVTLNGSTVSAWNDLIASPHNYSQGTAGQQPTYHQTALNGRPTISFDGSNDTLTSTLNLTTPSSVNPQFMWFVMKQRTWTSGQRYFGGHSANNSMVLFANPGTPNIEGFNGIASAANNGAAVGSWVRGEVLWAFGANDYVKLGSVSPAPASMGTATAATGRDIASSFGTQFAAIDIVALSYWAGKPTAGELTKLSSAVIAMYGAAVGV